MNKRKIQVTKIVQFILGLMMVGSFLFFVLGQVFLPAENNIEESTFRLFQSDWVRIMPDGTQIPVSVPGECGAKHGEWVTIETKLPQNQEDTSICVRSMQQELKIYVGDELRKEYSTLDTQPFGKTSTLTYVFFPVYANDAGDTLRIEFMSDSAYFSKW